MPRVIILMTQTLMIEINPMIFLILKIQNNKIMARVHKLVVQFLNTCHIFISYIVVARKVTHKVQLHLD